MHKEEWKQIKDYPEYLVSNTGFVKRETFFLKPNARGQGGYFSVSLSKDGIVTAFYIHRLVAEAFIPNPENKYSVNHIDGNRYNNRIENLEWATGSEQNNHALETI